jgi:chromosomal replication initiation ATPase DnaA
VDSAKVQTAEFGKKLREHFEYGDAVTLNAPGLDGRVRILENKLMELTAGSRRSYAADDLRDVLEYIAEKESTDMRRLTGALARTVACTELLNQEMNMKLAEEILDKEDCMSDNAVI